jgi:uncharacterized protein YhaN
MRFSRLSLERYGRFEDCELTFRSGSPDLHIIYGANEAGKTTSLSAVSDLLFGFPIRSPYNFQFDYALLRVAATLEEGGRTLDCRRKRGKSATLLARDDTPIDEAPLIAMLKGQTRDTFGFSFSLDQEALRSGGRAMVEAKNDLGRALFAAGSGLTGIADELTKLETEADAIWAVTASQRRTFTQAQRQLADAVRAIRDSALKPKAWADARQAAERAYATLEAARKARDDVQSELRAADRIRRLAPLVRRRNEHLEQLRSHEVTVDIGKAREESAEAIIREADNAQRERAVAEQLRGEAADRRGKVEVDPAILAQADEIDRLMTGAGASEKGARDFVRLEGELAAAEALIERLRTEAGANADAAPPRAVAAMLRDLAKRQGELAAAGAQIAETRADIEDRRRRARSRLEEMPADTAFDELIDAVDAARALGTDADARSDGARRKSDTAAAALSPHLARLAPWHGGIGELLDLPHVGNDEIETTRAELVAIMAEIRREKDQVHRSADQVTATAFEIEQLGTRAAVSPEEIASARQERQQQWQPIRDHVLSSAALPSPAVAVAGFETSVSRVDERTELRFTLADASSRLTLLEQSRSAQQLQGKQAEGRAEVGRRRHADTLETWRSRLSAAGLPALEPTPFSAWQTAREAMEAAHEASLDLRAAYEEIVTRRNSTRQALAAALGATDADGLLAPVLAIAERRRKNLEEASRLRQLTQEQLDQIESQTAALDRRQQRLNDDVASNAGAWREALLGAGLQMDAVTCGAVLDLLDELRHAITSGSDLRRRVEGIQRDTRDHGSRVGAMADGCGIAPGDTATRLRALRDRLAATRTAATLAESLEEEERRRGDQVDVAAAKLKAADDALASLLIETASTDRGGLAAAIERSRARRGIVEELSSAEQLIIEEGDGLPLNELTAAVADSDPDQIADRVSALNSRLGELNDEVDRTATAHGGARSAFAALDTGATSAADAAADAEQARAELEVLAEHYILKRAQAVTLRWVIEKYRERHQDPLLLRAGDLFSILTVGRYATLRVDTDGPTPRLLGLREDGRTMVEVGAMSEGTTDQLFLALRLAALEQSVAAGINLPFLADDLFVNFDDQRAEAGFRVLAEVARSTQVLFFTHHPHLVAIAKSVVGSELHSECAL